MGASSTRISSSCSSCSSQASCSRVVPVYCIDTERGGKIKNDDYNRKSTINMNHNKENLKSNVAATVVFNYNGAPVRVIYLFHIKNYLFFYRHFFYFPVNAPSVPVVALLLLLQW